VNRPERASRRERAVVLSVGYSFGDERKNLPDPDRLTREENDWTSAQVTTHPSRLIGFCSANLLRPVALEELERCLELPGMVGIKIHLGNAGMSLRDAEDLVRVQQLFALAQQHRAPVLVHMRARGGTNYGAEDAQILLDEVVPGAPDVEIIVAHLGSSGPGYSTQHDEVMAVFAAAAERDDPRMEKLYFDVASNITEEITPEARDFVLDGPAHDAQATETVRHQHRRRRTAANLAIDGSRPLAPVRPIPIALLNPPRIRKPFLPERLPMLRTGA
jgi:predicted TIM-barrel fold metal-dependent hydrolase